MVADFLVGRRARAGEKKHWSIFFGTENIDKSLQAITQAGGTVLQPAQDTPYGRTATASDPTGATFGLTSLHG